MRNWTDSAFIGTHGEVRSSTSLTTTQYLDALELGIRAASAMYAESYWPGFLRRTFRINMPPRPDGAEIVAALKKYKRPDS